MKLLLGGICVTCYRPHPSVCPQGKGRGVGTPWSLVPGPFSDLWYRPFPGWEGGIPQSCHWPCPKSCPGPAYGVPLAWLGVYPNLGQGGTPSQDRWLSLARTGGTPVTRKNQDSCPLCQLLTGNKI